MGRSLSCPSRRQSESERGKRTRTPYNKDSSESKRIVRDFQNQREDLFHRRIEEHSGLALTRKYTRLMDRFIRALLRSTGDGNEGRGVIGERLAIVALGSYGRQELCPGSDVDLLVIHRDRISPDITAAITGALYPLWDAKLDVGHAVLTIPECIRLVIHDFRFMTAVMDARFLAGSRTLYQLFKEALWSRINRERHSFLNRFLIYQQKRKDKYDSQGYFVEPDIKEGLGGLRDLHFMAWMARTYFKANDLRALRNYEAFSHLDIQGINRSKSHLLKVRNQLHRMAGRKEDRLLLESQRDLSIEFGYSDRPNISGPERFMRQVYRDMNRIRYGWEEFSTKAIDILEHKPFEPSPARLPREFRILKGNLVLRNKGLLRDNPVLILKGFNEAKKRGLLVGSDFIWEARKAIAKRGKDLLRQEGASDLFLDILTDFVNPTILRIALEIGLIDLFIPEFRKIRNLAQFSYYHVETVDLHSLKTLEMVRDIAGGVYDERWPVFREVFQEIGDPRHLYLAALLHDIGKGYPGDHTQKGAKAVSRILGRLGVDNKTVRVIRPLVKHHLLMVRVSQRRDLNEERTSIQVAQILQDLETLKLLFLLTIADSMATGPMAHSDWKILLFIELYFKVRHILERGTLASPDATRLVEENKNKVYKALAPCYKDEDILDLMDQVSPRYMLNTPLEDILDHFELALNLGNKDLSWKLKKVKNAPVTRIILCTHDRPGLFSMMVGVFTLNDIDVLSANIFTLKNGLAFDTYEVTNPLDPYRESERWEKVRGEISMTLEDRLPLDDLITRKGRRMMKFTGWRSRTKKVNINNEVSDFFTSIEVEAGGRVGLLYELAKKIFAQGLDIRFARVNSDREMIYGVFYVRDSGGQKVYDQELIQRIRLEVMSVI
ncbi:MAG: [protein-PII] uridylyltransferase [Deltaproteobacteria bacterium]|nr:[protein-PII] uridylyltransferase [Deltaproteobacteria bacterium]